MVMQQQINLYKFLPKKSKSYFTLEKIFLLYGIFILLLVIFFGNALWQKHKLTKEYEQDNLLFVKAQQKFLSLIKQYPSIDVSNIKASGESLRTQLSNELKIINLLKQSSKFSVYMEGLAEAIVPNVWLTEIYFSVKEPHIVLKGNAIEPLSAQNFLDQLLHQSAFTGLPFKIADLTQVSTENGTILTFNMTTQTTSAA
jgi:Tfp pilus assembly protein PilN